MNEAADVMMDFDAAAYHDAAAPLLGILKLVTLSMQSTHATHSKSCKLVFSCTSPATSRSVAWQHSLWMTQQVLRGVQLPVPLPVLPAPGPVRAAAPAVLHPAASAGR
jgi:hypothetical protein